MRISVRIVKNVFKLPWFVLIITALGCGLIGKNTEPWQPVKQKKKSFVHTVQYPRENLKVIAHWYTGKDKYAKALADANPNINPNLLLVGNRIYIPGNLLKTRKPMPPDYIKKWMDKDKTRKKSSAKTSKPASKKKNSSKKVPPPAENDDDLDLFGPK